MCSKIELVQTPVASLCSQMSHISGHLLSTLSTLPGATAVAGGLHGDYHIRHQSFAGKQECLQGCGVSMLISVSTYYTSKDFQIAALTMMLWNRATLSEPHSCAGAPGVASPDGKHGHHAWPHPDGCKRLHLLLDHVAPPHPLHATQAHPGKHRKNTKQFH